MVAMTSRRSRSRSKELAGAYGNLNPVRLVKTTLYLLPVVFILQALTVFSSKVQRKTMEEGKVQNINDLNTSADVNGDQSESITYPAVPKRLEFVHITKTGGSAIEKAGANYGLTWGACHYMAVEEVGCMKPDLPYTAPNYQSYALTSPWHTPPKLLSSYVEEAQNPYKDADLFAVVRNPYDRVVSEYYCPWMGFQARFNKKVKHDKDPNDPVHLNWWVKDMVKRLEDQLTEFKSIKLEDRPKEQRKDFNEDPRLLAQKHYVNQAEYAFDGEKQIVKNIVHYENLQQEFNALMKKYGLDIKLPPKDKSGVYTEENSGKRVTYRDLDEESIALINRYAKDDFDVFGYEMVDKFEEGTEYNKYATVQKKVEK